MVFYFYEDAMKGVDKISVDGIVPNSHHLSHWPGNQTPAVLKADTATEIVFRYLCHPDKKSLFPKLGIVTNNHFDTDGLLSAWALLNPKKAEPMAGRLISAAEAGDFSAFSSEEGVQIDLLIKALCYSENSPVAEGIRAYRGPKEAAFYKVLLPMLPNLFRKKDDYRSFWRPSFDDVLHSMSLFEKGVIGLEEYEDEGLSVVIDEKRPARQAIDHYCQGMLILVVEDREKAEGGFSYELEYRYYAWAETVTRPPIQKIKMEALAEKLNRQENHKTGLWLTDNSRGISRAPALKFSDEAGGRQLSRLHPNEVIQEVLSHLRKNRGECG
jgi:hypothetical protein